MKIFAVFFLSLTLLAGCASEKKNSSPEQQSVTDSDTTEVAASADVSAQDTLKTQKYSGQADVSGLTLKTGQLNYTGNEPFTSPAIFVNANETYKLKADETFMNETFKSLNGKQVSMYGKVKELGGSYFFEVHYYELNENK